MKTKITLLLTFVLSTLMLHAQTPQKFNYQAVVRNNSGTPIINTKIAVKIQIHETTATGTVVYEETHTPTTNAYGVFSIQVGSGVPVSGTFNTVAWNSDQHYVETSIDLTGGTNYKSLGTNELVSVPYALHAQTVENDKVDDADADSTNEIQTIIKVGNKVTLSKNGGSFTDEVYDGDSSASNELQTISKSGHTVTLSNGGGTFTDAVDDADASPTNEIQTVTKSGNQVTLSNNGGNFSVADADSSASNELQKLGRSGSNILLSNGGGTVSIEDADASPTNELQTVSKSGNQVSLSNNGGNFSVADADSSTTNEIQTISKSGSTVTLSLSGGSFTDAVDDADASPTNEIQTLTKSGNQVTLSKSGGSISVADADSSTSNEIQTISATTTDLTLSKSGGTIPLNNINYWKKNGNYIYESSRNIGIGTTAPANFLHVIAAKSDTALAYFYNNSGASGSHAIKAAGANGPTMGYLGVHSKNGFDNNNLITFPSGSGHEVGILGVSTGGSSTDNIGVMGLTNGGRAGYFKNTGAKTQVSIGVSNYGIYIDTGRLYVQDDALVDGALRVKKDAIIDGNMQVKKDVFVDGNLGVSQYIVHQSDNDTYLNFTPDRLTTVVGNYAMMDLREDGTSSYISFAPSGVNSGFGGLYGDAKLRVTSTTTENNRFALIVENARNTNNETIGLYAEGVNSGAYNQTVYGAYFSGENKCNGSSVRYSYGSWSEATCTSTTGTSASVGVVGSVSTTDNSDVRYAGYFFGDAYASNFYSPSDQNLKTNISTSSSSLDKILALPIKTYDYKTNEFIQMGLPEGTQTGIMAQDLEKEFPALVKRAFSPALNEKQQEALTEQGVNIPETAKKDVEFKAVNYYGLIPHLTSAIQEQQQIINDQNAQIQTQNQVNAEQTKELNELKAELEKQKKLLLELQALLTK